MLETEMTVKTSIQAALGAKKMSSFRRKEGGFLLPVVIVLSVAISIVSVVAMKGIAENSTTLNNQYYDSLAREAAKAGIEAAAACIRSNTATWDDTSSPARPLTPLTDCAGSATSGATSKVGYVAKNDNWESTYSVKKVEAVGSDHSVVTSIGSVTFSRNGTVVPSLTKTATVRTYATTSITAGSAIKPATALSTGSAHACTIATASVFCWGLNTSGQLGNNSVITSASPVAVVPPLAGKTVTKIAAGADHTCAIADGQAYCWGKNDKGQLGDRTNTNRSAPVLVDASNTNTAATAAQCTGGYNIFGNCRSGYTPAQPAIPPSSLYGKTVKDIQAGNSFTCAVTNDDKISCWVDNQFGQLGVNDRVNRKNPTQVYALAAVGSTPASALYNKSVEVIAKMSGNDHVCVLLKGTPLLPACWGRNYAGQVGNDTIAYSNSEVGYSCPASDPPIVTTNDVLRPVNVSRGGPMTTSFTTGATNRPASSIQNQGVRSIGTYGTYTTIIADDGKAYWWGGTTSANVFTCSPGCFDYSGDSGPCMADTYREYTSTMRPYGPMYKNTRAFCWMYLYNGSASCGNVVTPLDNQSFSMFSGNANSGVFCGVLSSTSALYCEGTPTQNNKYTGHLGNASLPVNTSMFNNTGVTPYAVTIPPWMSGRIITDIQAGGQADQAGLHQGTAAYTCILTASPSSVSQVACWGRNNNGQLGNGTTDNAKVPTPVSVSGVLGGGSTPTKVPAFNDPISF